MESSLLYTASTSFSELLEPSCVMDQTESSFYDSMVSSPSVSSNCNPSCGNYNISYDTIHSPSCENFKNLSYEKFQRINTYPSPAYDVSAVEIFASPPYEMSSQPRFEASHDRYYVSQQSNVQRVSDKPKILNTNTISNSNSNSNSRYNASYQSTDSYFHKPVRNQTTISNYKERLPSTNMLTCPDMPSSSTINGRDFHTRNQEFCELSPRQYFSPKSSPSLTSLPPPTLPTPPQSPPSSGSEEGDLERLVRDIPEILEMPRNPKNCLPGVEDILRDLQFEGRVFSECINPPVDTTAQPSAQPQKGLSSPPAPVKSFCGLSLSDNEEFKPIRKDSMWCGSLLVEPQTPTMSKMRTVSESSEESSYQGSDEQSYNCVYSDEEYGHLPETPYVSDEDADRHLNASPCPSPDSAPTPVTSSSSKHIVSTSVSTDHDYCNKRLAQRKANTATSAVSSTTVATSPTTPSTEVKRHLQLLIHESIKNKQKKGRGVAKPPKETGDTCRIVPSQDDEFDPSESPQKGGRTIGKPASYTKRMRDQHTEVLKTTKRRKTTAKDPEDDLEKRSNHNTMERNRRVNIKNLFDELRQQVPEILGNERASKVLILKKSTEYIKKLTSSDPQLELEHNILAQRRQYLEKKLRSMGMIQGL